MGLAYSLRAEVLRMDFGTPTERYCSCLTHFAGTLAHTISERLRVRPKRHANYGTSNRRLPGEHWAGARQLCAFSGAVLPGEELSSSNRGLRKARHVYETCSRRRVQPHGRLRGPTAPATERTSSNSRLDFR